MPRPVITPRALMLTILWALIIWAAIGFFLLAVTGSVSLEPSQSRAGDSAYDTSYTISVTNNSIISQAIYYFWFWPFE